MSDCPHCTNGICSARSNGEWSNWYCTCPAGQQRALEFSVQRDTNA